MTEKICSKCKQAKELACFQLYTYKGRKLHRANCKDCQKVMNKSWRERNKDHVKAYEKKYREENKKDVLERTRDWRNRNREHISKYNKEKYWADPDAHRKASADAYWRDVENNRQKARKRIEDPSVKAGRKENMKDFIKKNPDYFKNHRTVNKHKYAAHAAKRRHIKRASSANLTEEQIQEMRDIYWLARDLTTITGEPYEVDHIVPIKGKNVCGLHVPWNLQVLPMDLNRAKNNKYSEDEAFC